jgi:hypothetical protein
LLQSRKLESFLRVSGEAGHAERALKSLFVDDALHAGCKVPSAWISASMVKTFRSRTVRVSTEQE